MKKTESEMEDELRPQYDLRSLQVRKLGAGRKHFDRVVRSRSEGVDSEVAAKKDLTQIDRWRHELGLFPVPLFGSGNAENKYVLLNGNRGNFCLDVTDESERADGRNMAWSSNVGHYVSLVSNGYIEVQSWDQKASTTNRYSYQSVASNLEKFHAYLIKDEPSAGHSIVSHVIRVYRSLRSLLGPDVDGSTSLKPFLYLIASVTDEIPRGEVSLRRWSLDREAKTLAGLISDSAWEALRSSLLRERSIQGLTPIPQLILRHASGQVFQEAHYEAVFASQPSLFMDFDPTPVDLKRTDLRSGVHFTPPALARTLVEESLANLHGSPRDSIIIFDPACGSGEFLREALRQLSLTGYPGKIVLKGWDISLAACDMARFVLAWEMRGLENQVTVEISCTNSLTQDKWPTNVDLLLMNPPFVSWHDMDIENRNRVRTILGDLFREQPDLSTAFLWRAVSCIRDGGVLGSILPASFLNGSASRLIRRELGEMLSSRLIGRLGSHLLFPGAMIDAALYVGVGNGNAGEPPITFWADYRSASSASALRTLRRIRYSSEPVDYPVQGDGFSIYPNPDSGEGDSSWAPRPHESWKLLSRLSFLPTVKDLFDVHEGAKTGHNPTFILSKEAWMLLPQAEREYFRPAVVNKSIENGFLMNSTYVFYPYGEKTIASENQLRSVLKTYYAKYLAPNKQRLLKRSGINPAKWWCLRRPGNWQIAKPRKLVSTSWGDIGSFAWDGRGEYVVVQGHAWLWKGKNGNASLPAGVGLAHLAIVNSSIFSELLAAVCNHVGGGQWDLAERFVSRIAIPDLMSDEVNPELIAELSKIGKSIHQGRGFDEDRLTQIARLVYRVGEIT